MKGPHDPARVSAAEIGRNFGEWQSRALIAPVIITHHGRDRLFLSSITHFELERGATQTIEPGPEILRLNIQLRTLVEQIHECFLTIDNNMLITSANNKAELYIGLTIEDMRGRDLRDLKTISSDTIAWEYYSRIMHVTHEPVQFLVEPVMREGPTLTITAFPYGDEVGVLFSGTSPHEEALHRLRRERALLAAVAADPRMSNVQLTLRGGITAADESFAVLTGFSLSELTTMMLTELLHPHDRASVTRALDEALRAVSSATILARLLARNGDIHRLRLNFSAVSGHIHAAAAVAIAVDLGPATD